MFHLLATHFGILQVCHFHCCRHYSVYELSLIRFAQAFVAGPPGPAGATRLPALTGQGHVSLSGQDRHAAGPAWLGLHMRLPALSG